MEKLLQQSPAVAELLRFRIMTRLCVLWELRVQGLCGIKNKNGSSVFKADSNTILGRLCRENVILPASSL